VLWASTVFNHAPSKCVTRIRLIATPDATTWDRTGPTFPPVVSPTCGKKRERHAVLGIVTPVGRFGGNNRVTAAATANWVTLLDAEVP
jgi:hypothetical protein